MITELSIKNFAIIDDLSIPFGPGLNVITGETGAGKSIIIEALGLITGDRASTDIIRSGEDVAEVTAVFKTEGKVMAVKRRLLSSGKSKTFLNERQITLSELKALSPLLLEISSQHEHQKLLDDTTHLEIVDRFGGLFGVREKYKSAYKEYTGIKSKLSELEKLADSKSEQHEFLSFQLNEINTADLKKDEEERLLKEKKIIKHAAMLFEKVKASEETLYSSENSITSTLDNIYDLLKSAGEIDGEIAEWLPLSEQASAAVNELSRNLQSYLERLDVDPEKIEEIESRLYEISRLKKKYGGSVETILEKKEALERKLSMIDGCDAEIERLSKEEEKAFVELTQMASELSASRQEAAENLSEMTQKELNTLGLTKTTFAPGHHKVKFEQSDETGIDGFNFLISPNPGEPLKPLSRIASGGELSRIMLAIKNVLLGKVGLASLEVFDEVDVGIGGANAEVVGRKLKEMSRKRQIICITHLPQVASFGDCHIVVSKEAFGKRTVTRFKLLDDSSRINEIARMLGGIKITETTKEHAKEMLMRGVK